MQAADDSGVLHHGWSRWLLNLAASLGWARGTPIYGDLAAAIQEGTDANLDGEIALPGMGTGADTIVQFRARLPNWYRNGTDIEPFVEYVANKPDAGDVVWELGYAIGGIGDTLSETVESKTQAKPDTFDLLDRVSFTAIDGSDFAKGDVVVGKVKREGLNAADTFGYSILLVAVGFKLQREGIGWKTAHP